MTPDARKKPLPASRTNAFPDLPRTTYEWRYFLQAIKSTYLRGQWKQCALRCKRILHQSDLPSQSLYATYLHFYLALSTEAIACQMHNLAPGKFDRLEEARNYFEQTAISVPQPLVSSSDGDSVTASSHLDVDDAKSMDESISSLDANMSPRRTLFLSTNDANGSSPYEYQMKPVPSHIKKALQTGYRNIGDLESEVPSTPSPLSVTITPPKKTATPPSSYDSNSRESASMTSQWEQSFENEQYTARLQDFSQTIAKHITTVNDLIASCHQAQTTRYAITTSSAIDDGDMKYVDIRKRIALLKARNWKRERFQPDKYQRLSELALREL